MPIQRFALTLLVPGLVWGLLAVWGTAAQAQDVEPDPKTDPFCQALPPEPAMISAQWQHTPKAIKVLTRAEGESEVFPGVKVKFTLFPSDKVTLPARPANIDKVKGFAGLLTFKTGKAGAYRISLNQYIWLEMLSDLSGPLAGVLNSDKRMNFCVGLGKNLSFELAGDTRYWIQMSGGDQAETEFLMSALD